MAVLRNARITNRLLACVGLMGLLANASLAEEPDAGPNDRVYVGTSRLIADRGHSCEPPHTTVVELHNDRFVLGANTPMAFAAQVRPDGSFYAVGGGPLTHQDKHMLLAPVLKGRIVGDKLVADFGTLWCHYAITASRGQRPATLTVQ